MHLEKYTLIAALLLVLLPSVLSQVKPRPKNFIGKKLKAEPVTPEPEVEEVQEVISKHQNVSPPKAASRGNSVSDFLQKRKKERLESTTEFNPQADLLNKFMAKAAIVIDTTHAEAPVTQSAKVEVKPKTKQQLSSALKRSPRKHEAVATTSSPISKSSRSDVSERRTSRRQNLERRFSRIRPE